MSNAILCKEKQHFKSQKKDYKGNVNNNKRLVNVKYFKCQQNKK